MGEPLPSDETGDFGPVNHPVHEVRSEGAPRSAAAPPSEVPSLNPSEQVTEAAAPFDASGEVEAVLPLGETARLHLEGEIARGGMGAVLKGRDLALGRDVAVKVLLKDHDGKPEFSRRFLEEARIAGQLQHPGVAPVYELGVLADRRPYFTMKLVKGQTLAALLTAGKELPAERPRFLGIFVQVCQTLAYAHAQGVIHRDLKPSNIMVGAFGEVQVMDWGLAKVLARGGAEEARVEHLQAERPPLAADPSEAAECNSWTQAGTMLGTPAYLAPEQARGDVDQVDERADVFGLGAILCEILTGAPPFVGKRGEVMRKAQAGRLEDAYRRLDNCGADGELISLAKRCLAAEPSARPRQAGQVAEEMTAYQQAVNERLRQAELERAAADARAVEEGRTRQMAEAKAREERRRRRLTVALVAAVLLLVLLGGGGWMWVRQHEETRWAETARQVEQAVREAQFLRGQAETTGDLARWAEARAAAQRAEVLAQSDGPPALRQRTQQFLGDLERALEEAKARAAQAEKDRRLIAQLLEIRSSAGDRLNQGDQDFAATNARYAQAVRDYGLDFDSLDPHEAKDLLLKLGAGMGVELAACIDDWAHARRMSRASDWAGATRLTQIAQLLDPDPIRQQIRAAIDGQRRLVLRVLAKLPGVENAPPPTVNLLAVYLGMWGNVKETIELLRSAQRHHPSDFQINHNLGWFLLYRSKPARPAEALRFATAALAARPQSLAARLTMADACVQLNRVAEAADLYREMIQRQPQPWLYVRLGGLLAQQGKTEAGLAAFRKAVELDPNDAWAHNNLRSFLKASGKLDEAFAECVRSGGEPGRAELIPAFVRQGRLEEACAIWRKVLESNPPAHKAWYGYAELCLFLGHEDEYRRVRTTLLARFGNTDNLQIVERAARTCLLLPASEEEWRQANALIDRALAAGPKHALYHYFQLVKGLAEYRHDRPEQAIPLLRASAAHIALLAPRLVLAMAQYRCGRQDEARQTLAAAFAAGRWDEIEAIDAGGWIQQLLRREAEELIVPHLSAFLQGRDQPRTNKERLEFIDPCRYRKRYVAAAQLYADAFADDAKLAGDWKAGHRYRAACCAALSGAGQGEDGKRLSDSERAHWRQQAVDWLRCELATYNKLLADGKQEDRALVRQRREAWPRAKELAGIRREDALDQLPAQTRAECDKLWAEAAALLKQAEQGQK